MNEFVTRQGTRVRHGASTHIEDATRIVNVGASRRTTVALSNGGTSEPETAALLEGLTFDENAALHDAFSIVPTSSQTSTPPPAGGRRVPTSVPVDAGPAEIEVEVAPGETTALLIEQDGVYEWRLPQRDDTPPARRTDRAVGGRRVTFRLDAGAPTDTTAPSRRGFVEPLVGVITDRVRAFVFKFVAGKVVDGAARFLERHIKPGLITISDGAPQSWQVTNPTPATSADLKQPKRILLLVHGTFSSTRGSFGALGVTPEGKDFVAAARQRYDALLAYDHSTLAETPEQNATAILQALEGMSLPVGSTIDIVAYSRGGLVARVLVEQLLASAGAPVQPSKVVFVGSTNGGTALADPANWKTLLDLYTNLAVAAGRGLMIFDAGTASTIITESVKSLGSFVQACVDVGITDGRVPGLAAMYPSGELISKLNKATAEPVAANVSYYAIGSNFEPKLFDRNDVTTTLSRRLLRALADFGVDRLIGSSNDLVVNVEAMTALGGYKDRLAASLVWDTNAVIFHTNYFAQPEVVSALRSWLIEPHNEKSLPGVSANPPMLPADISVSDARSVLSPMVNDQVVVLDRPQYGYYVRAARYILSKIDAAAADLNLVTALDLRESQVANAVQEGDNPPKTIGMNGWFRISNGIVTEAMPPALARSSGLETRRAETPPQDRELPVARERRGQPGATDGTRRIVLPDEALVSRPPSDLRRGAVSDELPAGAPPPFADQTTEVSCHFGAEMPESVLLSEPADLTVTVSREELSKVLGPTVATSAAVVRLHDPIVLEVRARTNCIIVGDASVEVHVPDKGEPDYYDFKVRGQAAGPAEIWVDARQGARRLARMVLQPVFVASGKLKAEVVVDTRETDPPMLQLRVFERAEGPQSPFSLRFVLESRDLNLSLDYETVRFAVPREPYIKSLYEKLEGHWGTSGNDFQRFMRGLRAFGAELYTELVPPQIREAIWKYRNEIGSIEVISHEPFIPWEVLHVVEPGRPAPPEGNMFLAELGVARWIRNVGWPPAALAVRPGRARHVIPSYADQRLQLRGAQKERALVESLFGSAEVPADSDKVIELLAGGGSFDLLHLACHGSAAEDRIWDASLLMTGSHDQATGQYFQDPVTTIDVGQFADFRSKTPTAPIVFLNACQAGKVGRSLSGTGGMADAFIKAGAGLFVGTLWSIGDDTALTFAETFYKRLLDGGSVNQAVRAAREAAKQAKEPTWLAYTVYGHPYARLTR